MAKKTRQERRDHLGCMWGFMNMFTFRHGPLSHKLLLDHKHGTGSPRNNAVDNKDAQETHVGEERNVTITIIKPSVKKLIVEELFNDKEIKKQRENAEAGQLSDSELEGRRRKNNHRRKKKTRKNSCGNFSNINTADTEQPKVNRRTKKSSERNLDIDNMVEEICSEIHRRSAKNGMLNHKQDEDYKEKLRELVKFLISQKLLHGNRPIENNSEILTSKDLMEVFQILGSDEDLFLKLVQDPEILVPQKGEERLSLFEKQSPLADKRWSSSLFRRKDKTQQVTDDKEGDQIFILKPRRSASPDPGLSPDSHLVRNSSHLFLSEIKRKLKQAVRKEQQCERGFPKNVPTKEHFFLERMAKPSTSHYEDDKEQRVSNIYIEAKKHLSEMLNNGDVDSNSTSRHVPKSSLGTILSLPEHWSASADFINDVHISKRETHVSLPEDAMKNEHLPVCDLSKEPTDKSVDTEDGNPAGSADDVMIANGIDIVTEEANSTLDGDLPKAEAHDEQRDGIISKQASHEERQPPLSSSGASPSHLLAKADEECKSSPISVLEPLLIEDDISPPKMRSQSDEAQVQPWCIHFDEQEDSVPRNREDSVKTITSSDKELVFKYVRDVLDAVVSDFEEIYLKAQFSDQLLEPSLISNVPFCPNQLCHDHELLFDCINEALMELCCCPPWASFVAPRTRVFSTVKSIIHEVQEAVYWHLLPLPLPRALDQIVRKDLGKAGNWLDIRCDIDCIGFETSELILEELLEEFTLNCLNNTEHSLVPAELKTDESILVL